MYRKDGPVAAAIKLVQKRQQHTPETVSAQQKQTTTETFNEDAMQQLDANLRLTRARLEAHIADFLAFQKEAAERGVDITQHGTLQSIVDGVCVDDAIGLA